jgi:hypothetical protein
VSEFHAVGKITGVTLHFWLPAFLYGNNDRKARDNFEVMWFIKQNIRTFK